MRITGYDILGATTAPTNPNAARFKASAANAIAAGNRIVKRYPKSGNKLIVSGKKASTVVMGLVSAPMMARMHIMTAQAAQAPTAPTTPTASPNAAAARAALSTMTPAQQTQARTAPASTTPSVTQRYAALITKKSGATASDTTPTQLQAIVQMQIAAMDIATNAGNLIDQLQPLVDQLKTAKQTDLAGVGQAIIDRCNTVITLWVGPDPTDATAGGLDDPYNKQTAADWPGIQTDAQNWIAQANATLAAPTAPTTSPDISTPPDSGAPGDGGGFDSEAGGAGDAGGAGVDWGDGSSGGATEQFGGQSSRSDYSARADRSDEDVFLPEDQEDQGVEWQETDDQSIDVAPIDQPPVVDDTEMYDTQEVMGYDILGADYATIVPKSPSTPSAPTVHPVSPLKAASLIAAVGLFGLGGTILFADMMAKR